MTRTTLILIDNPGEPRYLELAYMPEIGSHFEFSGEEFRWKVVDVTYMVVDSATIPTVRLVRIEKNILQE